MSDSAGNYNIIIRDVNLCTRNIVVNLTNNSAPSINSVQSTNINCNGNNNGTVTINASGGTAPLTYSVNNGTTFQPAFQFNNMGPGQYTVVVKDSGGCQVTSIVNINEPNILATVVSPVASTCNLNNGSVVVHSAGGTSPYQFSINNGVTYQPDSVFTGLPSGNILITVKDANGCVLNTNAVIANMPSPTIAAINKSKVD